MEAINAIWDSLDGARDEIESPAWHHEVLRERLRQVETGEETFLSWDSAQKEIDRLVAQEKPSPAAQA